MTVAKELWFERYVNFEFYKTMDYCKFHGSVFERYVNFEFYKTALTKLFAKVKFERYVNFEFYKTSTNTASLIPCLRDM